MLMCKCECCRTLFYPEDVSRYREDYGEYFLACPECGGDFDEIEVCDDCDIPLVFDWNLDTYVCPECGKEVA